MASLRAVQEAAARPRSFTLCRVTKRRPFGSVRKYPSGHYQASYWWEGARHIAPKVFERKSDASAWLANVHADVQRGMWIDPAGGKITVAQLAARWLAEPGKRKSSRDRDETIVRVHVLPSMGPRRIARITRADVQRLVDSWEGSPSTVGRQYSAMRAMFQFAVASDLLARTPCHDIKLPRVTPVRRPTPDPDVLGRLAAELGAWAPFMWLGAVGGLRWAEVAGLTVADLDLLGGRLTVARQVSRAGTLDAPKTAAGARTLALPAWLVDDLAAHLAGRGLTGADVTQLVFSTGGRPLDYTNWRRRVWVPACRRAGVPGLRFHDLRSMAATVLVASGVDVKTAQTRLGHSSPDVTLRIYARALDEKDREAADTIGHFFDPTRVRRASRSDGNQG